jgi:hypothetical protein
MNGVIMSHVPVYSGDFHLMARSAVMVTNKLMMDRNS